MKFLYIQHVDWNWLPQRPQYLAKELQDLLPDEEVVICYIRAFRRRSLVASPPHLNQVIRFPLFGIPFWHYPVMRHLSSLFLNISLRRFGSLENVHVWVTHPRIYAALRNRKIRRLTYDCMDDAVSMAGRYGDYLESLESELCSHADDIISTSPMLQKLILDKYQRSAFLVRNGINLLTIQNRIRLSREESTSTKRAIFFGVIGDWIDQERIMDISRLPNWSVELYGPMNVPLHPELATSYQGILSQEALYNAVAGADLALLPYLESTFVNSIDPVKMYEYVALTLPILATPIDSLEPFESLYTPWVRERDIASLLSDTEEIYPLMSSRRTELILNCEWSSRAKSIINLLGLE